MTTIIPILGNKMREVEKFLQDSGLKRGFFCRHSFVGKKPPYEGIRAEVEIQYYGREQTVVTLDYNNLAGDKLAKKLRSSYPQ